MHMRSFAVTGLAVGAFVLVHAFVAPAGAAPARPEFTGTAWSLAGTVKVSVKRLPRIVEPRQALVVFDSATEARIDAIDEAVYEFTWVTIGRKGNRVRFTYEPGSDAAFDARLAEIVEATASAKLGLTVNDVVVTADRTKVEAVLDVRRNRLKLNVIRTFTGRSESLDRSFRGKYRAKASGGPAAG